VYKRQGIVTGVESGLSSHFAVGETLTYSFLMDTDTPDNDFFGPAGGYEDGVSDFSARIGDNNFGMGTDSFLSVNNGNNGQDEFNINIHNPTHNLPIVPSLGTQHFTIALIDETASALNSDAIPTSLILGSFTTSSWALNLSIDDGEVFGIVTSANVSPVPLPAALPLFGTGLGIMGFIGWRRKRRMAEAA